LFRQREEIGHLREDTPPFSMQAQEGTADFIILVGEMEGVELAVGDFDRIAQLAIAEPIRFGPVRRDFRV
jgi:hypothetical protein